MRQKRGGWGIAKRTACSCGRIHASKLEARTCAKVRLIHKQALAAGDLRLFQQARFPLLSLPPDEAGRPFYHTPDFVLVDRGGQITSVYEAKGRESKDWKLRKRAFEATYGVSVVVVRK